jgi:hypothetical protein
MRLYFTRSFHREATKERATDEDCREAIHKAQRGLVDADLGKGLIKQRIAEARAARRKGRAR